MTQEIQKIFVNKAPMFAANPKVQGDFVELLGEAYYRIGHCDQMPPFFMSLVSSSDHWFFIASNGGLTAGRQNPESALFPYETEDKIIANHERVGGKTVMRVERDGLCFLWEPFSDRYAGLYQIERNLYKNVYGNKLIFEEINHDLQLTLQIIWRMGDRFGFVRGCRLQNSGPVEVRIELLDGLQNILPYGATAQLQTNLSSLLNGYKRNELDRNSGLGLFALSATLTDRAEPSESLKASVAWQVGLPNPVYLLSSQQIDAFRYGRSLLQEEDVRGRPGAFFAASSFNLASGALKEWTVAADVNQDAAGIVRLINFLGQDEDLLMAQIDEDIASNSAALVRFVAAADGLQLSAQESASTHHFTNVLFNIMRGGIFSAGYQVWRDDLLDFVQVRNRHVLGRYRDWFVKLPEKIDICDLYAQAAELADPDLVRLCYEYLPLIFSRRHGDPSRPWNQFSINLKKADGSPNLDYQGNWRDIFQNWEPLLYAFPAFVEGVIAKFLNATTADGYNPYRVLREGIEWEVPEPDNPWANIGYWSDHQIIYLQKLLEFAEQAAPGRLIDLWNQPVFAYANVPYRIRPYADMLADWYDTIDFDWAGEQKIEAQVAEMGTDGKLILDGRGHVVHATMIEKLLVLLLAKLTNLVPGGGIWMNTQRPEWNDANNALVGKGLSVVTTAYLRRFIAFWQGLLAPVEEQTLAINATLFTLLVAVHDIFKTYEHDLAAGFSDQTRRAVMDDLGSAVSAYRNSVYQEGIPPTRVRITGTTLQEFLNLALSYIDDTLLKNRREDGLAHTYNILRLGDHSAAVENLYLMLEGQVALLSSGLLTAEEVFTLTQRLRQSDLFREDQHTYILYPNRQLPGFLHKNNVLLEQLAGSRLTEALLASGDSRLLIGDENGVFHFNGRFRNANDVLEMLDTLAEEPLYSDLIAAERDFMLDLFDKTFNHQAFTGRSGTFFAYEGLGSIYWHMVSKLLLAVQECYQKALDEGADPGVIEGLAAAYRDIRAGLGFNKTPDEFGAFPTDPYSHTPLGKGAQQPGMTGVVKEEILARWGEMGITLRGGALCFAPTLLAGDELLKEETRFDYINVFGEKQTELLPANALAFTFCQVPIIYQKENHEQIEVTLADGQSALWPTNCLDQMTTQQLMNRDGTIIKLRVSVQI